MGLIKAMTTSISSNIGDQFKEFITCPEIGNNVLIQRGVVNHGVGNTNPSEGVISNGSAIEVPEQMAMMIVDNGKIVEFSAVAGTYTYDSSSEPSIFYGSLGENIIESIKTIGQRITFGGQTAKDQRVYYVNMKEIMGNTFGSQQPEVVADPVYGSVEITYNGEYSFMIKDPIVLITRVVGSTPKDTLTFDDIFKSDGGGMNQLKSVFAQNVSEAIAYVMTEKNISFNKVQVYKSDVTNKMKEILDADWLKNYGLTVENVSLRINASEESRKIVQEMDAKVAETTRMGQVYSNNMAGTMAAATGEAMKSAAANENGAMMGFMGMNMAQTNGANVMNAAANMQAPAAPVETPAAPAPGTIFAGAATAPAAEETKAEEDAPATPAVESAPLAFCPDCGAKKVGKFCTQCGKKLED